MTTTFSACPFCKILCPEEQHFNQCPEMTIGCPRKCGIVTPRKLMAQHVEKGCDLHEAACPYEYCGCLDDLTIREVPAHLVKKAYEHSLLLNKHVIYQQKVIDALCTKTGVNIPKPKFDKPVVVVKEEPAAPEPKKVAEEPEPKKEESSSSSSEEEESSSSEEEEKEEEK